MIDANEKISLCNGEFELYRIKFDEADEIFEFYLNNFVKYEPIHTSLKSFNCEIFKEIQSGRIRKYLKDEVSFAVRHCATKKLAAIRLNHMVTSTSPPEPVVKPLTPGFVLLAALKKRIKESFDIFKLWDIDCVLDMTYLTTNKDFGGRGLGTRLSQHSIDFARAMLNGTLKGRKSLPAHVRDLKPKAVTSLYSSLYTQKMGEKLGMQTLAIFPYSDFIYKDRPFSEIMDPIHTSFTCVAKRL